MGYCMCLLHPDGWIWCEDLNALWMSVGGAFVCCLWIVLLAVCVYCGVMYACDFKWRAKFPFRLFMCKATVLLFFICVFIYYYLRGGEQADMWVFPCSKLPLFASLTFMRFANLQYVKFVHILSLLLYILFYVYILFLVLFYVTIHFTYAFFFSVALHNFYFILIVACKNVVPSGNSFHLFYLLLL
jgi:hypothetical protein